MRHIHTPLLDSHAWCAFWATSHFSWILECVLEGWTIYQKSNLKWTRYTLHSPFHCDNVPFSLDWKWFSNTLCEQMESKMRVRSMNNLKFSLWSMDTTHIGETRWMHFLVSVLRQAASQGGLSSASLDVSETSNKFGFRHPFSLSPLSTPASAFQFFPAHFPLVWHLYSSVRFLVHHVCISFNKTGCQNLSELTCFWVSCSSLLAFMDVLDSPALDE